MSETTMPSTTDARVQAAPRKGRSRIFYLDLIRALSTWMIVLTHFNNPFYSNGGYVLTNRPFGVYLGDLSVSLFLILSGASLAVTYTRPLDLRRFYWKRFRGIFPMYWTAWVCATLFFYLIRHGSPLNAGPLRSIVWTFLGLDGYLLNFHVATPYILGEWFLGFILIFYLVFPILLWAVERFPKATAVTLAALFVVSVLVLRSHPGIPSGLILTVRLPELAFGIYFVRYFQRVPAWLAVLAALALCGTSLSDGVLQADVARAVAGVAVYVLLIWISKYVAIAPVKVFASIGSKYSYPVFLVHHVVIMFLFFNAGLPWNDPSFDMAHKLVLLVAAVVLTGMCSVALIRLERVVVDVWKRAFSAGWWRLAN